MLCGTILLAACSSTADRAATTTTTRPSPAEQSAKRLLDEAMSTARAAGSARIDSVVHQGSKSGEFINDSATSSGRQVITIGQAKVTVELVNGTAYVNANSAGLTQYFNFPSSVVPRAQNRWIAVQRSDSGYANVTSSVTLPGALKLLTPSSPITNTGVSVVGGQHVVGLKGSISGGSATVYVASSGKPYPVEVVATAGQASETAMLGNWGEPVNIVPPPNPIRLSSLNQH